MEKEVVLIYNPIIVVCVIICRLPPISTIEKYSKKSEISVSKWDNSKVLHKSLYA